MENQKIKTANLIYSTKGNEMKYGVKIVYEDDSVAHLWFEKEKNQKRFLNKILKKMEKENA